MLTFILWVILAVISLPLAIGVLIIYPFIWILLLPFRILGFAVEVVFEGSKTIILFPFRILKIN